MKLPPRTTPPVSVAVLYALGTDRMDLLGWATFTHPSFATASPGTPLAEALGSGRDLGPLWAALTWPEPGVVATPPGLEVLGVVAVHPDRFGSPGGPFAVEFAVPSRAPYDPTAELPANPFCFLFPHLKMCQH